MIRLVASVMPLTTKKGRHQYALETAEEQHVGYMALYGKDLPDKLYVEIKGKGIKEAIMEAIDG